MSNTYLTLDFTSNWNGKLFLDNFSTVRLYNEGKYFTGNELEIKLNGVSFGYAKVIASRKFPFGKISDLLAFTDTGKPAHYLAGLIRRFYGKKIEISNETALHHVVLHYTQRNIENQRAAIMEWWDGVASKSQTIA